MLSIAVRSRWRVRMQKKGQRLPVCSRTIDHRCEAGTPCSSKRQGPHKTKCKIHSMHHQVELALHQTPWNHTRGISEAASRKLWIPRTRSKGSHRVRASRKSPPTPTESRAARKENNHRTRQSTSQQAATCITPLRLIINTNRASRTWIMHTTQTILQAIIRERQHQVLWKISRCQARTGKMQAEIGIHLRPDLGLSFTPRLPTTCKSVLDLSYKYSRTQRPQTRNSALSSHLLPIPMLASLERPTRTALPSY